MRITLLKFLPVIFIFAVAFGSYGQQAELIKLDRLLETIEAPSEKIKIFNFWATWCTPCIKEIPYFEKVNQELPNVKVILVSMDIDQDPNPEKVYKFIARKKIKSQVLIIDEKNPRSWIKKIDKNWVVNIPVTLVVNSANGKRKFI